MLSACGMRGLLVDPEGSNLMPLNRRTASPTGIPYWRLIEKPAPAAKEEEADAADSEAGEEEASA